MIDVLRHPGRTWRTVRHLRPVQIADRILRRVMPVGEIALLPGAYRLNPRAPQPPARLVDGGYDGSGFGFLSRRHDCRGPDRWRPSGAQRLWTYHLHYFEYLSGIPAAAGLGLVEDWIAANPPMAGPGWEPYPLSLRIRSWIEWLLEHPDIGEDRRQAIVDSLARQAEALVRQVEYHLLGNHLLENGITLCWAGLSLDGPRSTAWLRRGEAILERELARQVLGDGTHDERSPMYQALLAEGLLRLAALAGDAPGETGRVKALAGEAGRKLALSLGRLVHPDGGYALLNDCALGEAPGLSQLDARFGLERRPAAGSWSLSDAGYFGHTAANGNCLIFDAGPLGPEHQPGHGHADMLSFELSLAGKRVFTDTGVMTYEAGPVRSADRGTAAHNTVELDGEDQAELWAAFRCGARPRIVRAGCEAEGGTAVFRGTAERREGRRWRHDRTISLCSDSATFEDVLDARGAHTARLRLHVAPGLDCIGSGGEVRVAEGDRTVAVVRGEGFDWEIGSSPYHPDFGVELERPCLVATIGFRDDARVGWGIEWGPR